MDPLAHDMLKEKKHLPPSANYNQTVAQIRKVDDRVLSLPRDHKQAENVLLSMRLNDTSYKSSGNAADRGQAVWNMCAENKTFVRRVAMDSEYGTPEVYIRYVFSSSKKWKYCVWMSSCFSFILIKQH